MIFSFKIEFALKILIKLAKLIALLHGNFENDLAISFLKDI